MCMWWVCGGVGFGGFAEGCGCVCGGCGHVVWGDSVVGVCGGEREGVGGRVCPPPWCIAPSNSSNKQWTLRVLVACADGAPWGHIAVSTSQSCTWWQGVGIGHPISIVWGSSHLTCSPQDQPELHAMRRSPVRWSQWLGPAPCCHMQLLGLW